VLLADRHHGLRDSVRGLLESEFESVIMVANETSLLEGAGLLKPAIVVLDLSIAEGDVRGLLKRIALQSPDSKVLMLTVHDERTVAETVLAAGADAVVLKSRLGTDLVPAVEALRADARYISPGISPVTGPAANDQAVDP